MQRRVEQARRTRQWSVAIIVAVLVVAVGVGIPAVLGSFNSAKSNASANSSASAKSCIYTKSGTAAKPVSLPPSTADTKASYTATIATNRGSIVIKLANSAAPCTVNSFVSLADQKFFNNTPCHRLTTSGIFVLQCGDPTGTGTGGPGYEFYTENLNSVKTESVSGTTEGLYPTGTVAMARSQSQDSNGSQFFLVYQQSPLPQPGYTPFGTIVSGLGIIQNVAKAGSDNSNSAGDGHPKQKVQIDSVTITKT